MGSAEAARVYFVSVMSARHTGMPILRALSAIVLDAAAGKDKHADRQNLEHGVIALEGRGFAVLRPVRTEASLLPFQA